MSIACDGVCLTLINISNKLMEFYLSNETIKRSKFKKTEVGDYINIETPLKFGNQLSGHIIQGHVDCVGVIFIIKKVDKSYLFDFIVNSKERKNLTDSFLKNKLFNEFYLFKSPNKLGSMGKLNVSTQLHQLAFKYKSKSNINSFTGKDIINIYS